MIILKKQCPCCGYYTIDNKNEVITDICDVCFWEYDEVAQKFPDKRIGPNKISLNEAKDNYKRYGASKKEYAEKNLVRQPLEDEIPK